MKNLLGGKGNLCRNVVVWYFGARRFTISTESCTYYTEHGKEATLDLLKSRSKPESVKWKRKWAVVLVIRRIRYCCPVRSGARASMPGMMDTILNLGLNDEAVRTGTEGRRRTVCLGFLSPFRADVR